MAVFKNTIGRLINSGGGRMALAIVVISATIFAMRLKTDNQPVLGFAGLWRAILALDWHALSIPMMHIETIGAGWLFGVGTGLLYADKWSLEPDGMRLLGRLSLALAVALSGFEFLMAKMGG